MSTTGVIPEQILLVKKEPKELICKHDGIKYSRGFVRDTYPIDPNINTEKAISWGRTYQFNPTRTYQFNPTTRCRDLVSEPELETVENKPFSNLRLVDIDIRNNGGVALKVINEDGLMFDIRKDVFLESLFAGELEGDMLTGQYIWTRYASNMKIHRYNSQAFKEICEYQDMKNNKPIKMSELEVGHVYRTKKGDYYAYIGKAYEYGTFGHAFINSGNDLTNQNEFDQRVKRWISSAKKNILENLRIYKNDFNYYSIYDVYKSKKFLFDCGEIDINSVINMDDLLYPMSPDRSFYCDLYNKIKDIKTD